MSNNPDRQGPAFAGHWTECSPNSLYMTDHIGELTVSDGRKWGVSGSLNGLAIVVSTDLSYAADMKPRHGGIDHRRFMLDTGPLIKELAAELLSPAEPKAAELFQDRVQPWMMECFGPMIAGDREERNHRFLEEALELVQSCGCTANEALQLVDYVYGRDIGEPHQEAGGVMVTLAALCLANALDMHEAGETELARVWTKVEAIRAKQAAKPKHSPLPGPTTATGDNHG